MKRRALLAFATSVPIAAILGGCTAVNGERKDASTSSTRSVSTSQTTVPVDEQFIDMMVPHHRMAIQMAQLALTRGEHPEVVMLAGAITAMQGAEITQMQMWRNAWYGSDQTPSTGQIELPAGMSAQDKIAMSLMLTDMQTLQTAMPFDKAFLLAMISHHQTAVDAARIEQAQGEHAELKRLASAIIASRQQEITQMQGWHTSWYGA